MKDKKFYEAKIQEAETNIKSWKLKIYELENPVVNIPDNKEATKIVSIRVPKSKAAEIKKQFIQIVSNL